MTTPSSNIDVLKYQESLKQWLRQYPQFTDYDFEGTNFNVLLSILAYNAYNMAHYDHMVGNEAWVDTAELRQSQVSHATDLNYLPRSMISAQSTIEVEIFPNDQPQTIVLPKYYRFKSSDQSGNTVYFVTSQDYIAARDDQGRYIFRDVLVFQGEIVQEFFDVQGVVQDGNYTKYEIPFVISSENIDINSLEVFVKSSPTDPNPVKYTFAKTLAETTNQSLTYFIRGIYDNQYAIEFGDGTFGAAISNGNQISAIYRNTLGKFAQGNYVLTRTTDVAGYSNIVVNSATRVQGGFDRETVEELRKNSPRHFQIQDRAVTEVDYEGIVKQAFPNIQQVSVFGGEQIEQYGKVFIVLKPYGTSGIASNTIKNQIISLLKSKNIVPEPIVIDPSFYYIGIEANVFYDGNAINLTENQLRTNITSSLIELNDKEIGDFNINIYQSLLVDTIKKSDKSIVGCDVAMKLIKRWNPQRNINETLNIITNNQFRESLDGAYQSADDWTVTTNTFQVFINEQVQTAVIQDDGIGNLYYYIAQSSGVKIRTGQSIGSINYNTGAVNLVANVLDYNNYIEFTFKIAKKSISAIRDTFIILDGKDVDIEFKRL